MLLPVAAILPVLAAGALAQTPADNVQIRAAAQAFDDAQLHGDRTVLERMLAADYLLVRGSGRIGDRADFIAGFTDPTSRLERFEITDRLFIRPSADTAIVGGDARIHGTADGRSFSEHFRYSDTFSRRGGQWVVVYTQITPLPAP